IVPATSKMRSVKIQVFLGANLRGQVEGPCRAFPVATCWRFCSAAPVEVKEFQMDFAFRCGQLGVFTHSFAKVNRATGFPPTMCDSMISSRSATVTPPYQTCSG